MPHPKYFDAHNHIQNYSGPCEAGAGRAGLILLNGTAPDDWQKVLDLAAADERIWPCFGLHPWFINKAGPRWLEELELFLKRAPSCVGEIGLDGAKNTGAKRQEEVFTSQLKLAARLRRPVCLHCVKAWGKMLKIIKEELPGTFMLHSYGGPAEMIKEFSALGAYFSFGSAIMDPKRGKLREALLTVPPDRLLFETEPSYFAKASKGRGPAKLLSSEANPSSFAKASEGRSPAKLLSSEADPSSFAKASEGHGLPVLISAAADVMGRPAQELAELSWVNGIKFLGDIVDVNSKE
ncbi:MAG: hypothetical protein A2X34_06040 [Elusimicrobia bacterium GWC2_51_8]|nr:MAG: hypothetical protein A2X33_04920 [Elusimicrobia bacterium GWA2_51_34]OGR59000.1 MAG: hypothetical protein A2X34_06040 [Elusimicrobia bacterium GWC2_51_8]OGR87850.1 MAG: hypothetical protein A2021_10015 [Elusimicrobia bacterium GWF2_52_66]HAF95667.1 hypothetical protein [Elusimicrobiota bacterium]HCE97426.1 hypothetical protein [Elusimicrobiota bacterium]